MAGLGDVEWEERLACKSCAQSKSRIIYKAGFAQGSRVLKYQKHQPSDQSLETAPIFWWRI
jgi:hypothetical protein